MKYTVESFEEEFGAQPSLVTSLLETMKNSFNISEGMHGICYNLSDLILKETGDTRRMGYEIVEEFSKDWKHHSGSIDYPVPRSHFDEGFWEGEQLKYRLDLIDFIIGQLKEIK